jgi:hypothetical protein
MAEILDLDSPIKLCSFPTLRTPDKSENPVGGETG